MKKIIYISQNSTEDSMIQGVKLKNIFLFGAAIFVFLLFSSADIIRAQENPVGKVTGYIYAQDGSTPVEGAVIKFKNVSTGKFYESEKSDIQGYFAVEEIERGVYLYGVITPEASFNSEGLVGFRIKQNETARMNIALKPYSSQAALTMEGFYNDLDVNGESYVGRVIEVDDTKKNVKVKIERGFLQMKDKIRNKGREHDFKMTIGELKSEGSDVRRVFAGKTASLRMKKEAEIDDMVFVLKKRQFLPFLAGPLGAAAVIAASAVVAYGVTTQLQEECEKVSPEINKKKD